MAWEEVSQEEKDLLRGTGYDAGRAQCERPKRAFLAYVLLVVITLAATSLIIWLLVSRILD